ncbi:MAG TPA: universal stress protein [Pirellulaceae bacterium]|nr:universal stress protein [Pirellulaceae bacterium]
MPWLPKQTVVVPVDFSDASLEAIEIALGMVATPEHVRIVHVLPDLIPLEPTEVFQTFDNQSRIEHTRNILRERLQKLGHPELPFEVLFGDPGQMVAKFAADLKADLIILPSHGRTGFARMLIGSTAERVVRFAHCPVLVLRS